MLYTYEWYCVYGKGIRRTNRQYLKLFRGSLRLFNKSWKSNYNRKRRASKIKKSKIFRYFIFGFFQDKKKFKFIFISKKTLN